MSLENLPGYAEAMKALEANTSPRAKHMAELERYVEGTQYAGLPDWFSDEKPLWERAPCIVYPIVKAAIASNVDLLLGEGRFPTFTAEGLEGEDAEAFEKTVAEIVKQARLRAAAREIFAAAQGCGSACAIFGVRSGRLFIDTTKARWCEVELDAEGAVKRLEIRYPYLATVKDGNGARMVVARLYRRVVSDEKDVTYLPGEARPDGVEPQWTPDPKQSFDHGLGFCPVVWYPHMRGCAIVGDVDGRAIHEHLTDEVRALDFALSQRHRAALYAGDPQWTEVGVKPGYNPTSSGVIHEVPASISGRPNEPVTGAYVSKGRQRKARKKGPGTVWQYEAKDVQVKLHTLPGEALKAIDDNARDIRIKLSESLGVVFLDPETIPQASTLSGKALEALKSRQLDRCDSYRDDFGDRFLLPAIGMLLRIAQRKRVLLPEPAATVDKALSFFAERWSWRMPPLCATWGRYFRLDSGEEASQVSLVAQARDAGFATRRIAIEKLRAVLGIKDVDAYLEELEKERKKDIEEAQRAALDMSEETDGGGGGDEDEDAGEADGRGRGRGARRAREADGPRAAAE